MSVTFHQVRQRLSRKQPATWAVFEQNLFSISVNWKHLLESNDLQPTTAAVQKALHVHRLESGFEALLSVLQSGVLCFLFVGDSFKRVSFFSDQNLTHVVKNKKD